MKLNYTIIKLFIVLLSLQLIGFYFSRQNGSVLNSGSIFGLYGNNTAASILAVSLMCFLHLFVKGKNFLHFPFFLIFIGTISNLVDRIVYGGVIDYIKLWNIPVFNIADILIISGIAVFSANLISNLIKKTA